MFHAEGKPSLTLKRLSDTRWSSRADATRALSQNYSNIQKILEDFSKDRNQSPDTRRDATSLHGKMMFLETAFMAHFWDAILQRFKMTSVKLQKNDIDLNSAVKLLTSLESYVAFLRDNFDDFENSAKNLSKNVAQNYQTDKIRARKRKRFADESEEPETVLEGRQKFRIETFNVIIDRLLVCLRQRLEAYGMINNIFGVIFHDYSVSELEHADIRKRAVKLVTAYPEDLKEDFPDELLQFNFFVNDELDKSPLNLLQVLVKNGLQSTFPNVYVALRIFLTLPVTNCEGERTFSLMARVKNELRTTMSQNRLSALSLMAVESELVRQIDFEDIVQDFAALKARKKPIV